MTGKSSYIFAALPSEQKQQNLQCSYRLKCDGSGTALVRSNEYGEHRHGGFFVYTVCVTQELEGHQETDDQDRFYWVDGMRLYLQLDSLHSFNTTTRHFVVITR